MPVTPNTYKNGAVGISVKLTLICSILQQFQAKLLAYNDAQLAAGHIDMATHDTIQAFISQATVFCIAFQKLSKNPGA